MLASGPFPATKPTDETLTRVMALHAIAYCERLFYLEEIEQIRLADERVIAGRILHQELEQEGPLTSFVLESTALGIAGKFDAVRRQDGCWIVIEHKRGRSCKAASGQREAWDSDRAQVIGYLQLLAERMAVSDEEVIGRIRYHADRSMVEVVLDETAHVEFDRWMERVQELRRSPHRPPVTTAANRCLHCSLAPICLPEEERLARDPSWDAVRLFPPDDERQVLHVVAHGDRVGRSGERLVVSDARREHLADLPIAEVAQVVIHGNAQVSAQAVALCAAHDVQIHWISSGGRYVTGMAAGPSGVQRRIRQYEALTRPTLRLNLARRLVTTKVRDQLRHLLRVARDETRRTPGIDAAVIAIRHSLSRLPTAIDDNAIRGFEGEAGALYWSAFPDLLLAEIPARWRPNGRSRRPPGDACNALLSFLYALLYRDCVAAILAVGLEPSFGIHHTARSQAHPLAEDLMELFRVPLVDLPVVASLNRRQWTDEHAQDAGPAGWLLTDAGRRQAIAIYEDRKAEAWKHPATGYSLSYARLIELEVRLLEKEFTGDAPGLFARRNLR